jgi:hypothetical protein
VARGLGSDRRTSARAHPYPTAQDARRRADDLEIPGDPFHHGARRPRAAASPPAAGPGCGSCCRRRTADRGPARDGRRARPAAGACGSRLSVVAVTAPHDRHPRRSPRPCSGGCKSSETQPQFCTRVADDVDWTVEGTHPLAGRYRKKHEFIDAPFGRLAGVLVGGSTATRTREISASGWSPNSSQSGPSGETQKPDRTGPSAPSYRRWRRRSRSIGSPAGTASPGRPGRARGDLPVAGELVVGAQVLVGRAAERRGPAEHDCRGVSLLSSQGAPGRAVSGRFRLRSGGRSKASWPLASSGTRSRPDVRPRAAPPAAQPSPAGRAARTAPLSTLPQQAQVVLGELVAARADPAARISRKILSQSIGLSCSPTSARSEAAP